MVAAVIAAIKSNFPAHGAPVNLLDSFGASAHGQVRDQLPFNRLSSFWRAALAGVDHRKFESAITLLLPMGGRTVMRLNLISSATFVTSPSSSRTSM